MLKLFFTYITYIVPHENLKGFNCLFYKELKKLCLVCNEQGEINKEQFFNKNKHNKILIHMVPRESSTNKKFVEKYFQNLLKSYLDVVSVNIKFKSYSINEYNNKTKENLPLSIIQVFKTIYYSITDNQNYIKKIELMPDRNIEHARHSFTDACDLINEHIKKNSNIVIFDTLSKSEEVFALIYLILQKILQSYFFATDVDYYIFLLKFDDKKQSSKWSKNNTLTNADDLPINEYEFQILSYSYIISDLCPKQSKNKNVKDNLLLYQIYEYEEKAVRLSLNPLLKYKLQELYKNTLYVKYDINCYDNINNNGFNFKINKKKLNHFEFRNQIIIETLNKSFDFTINTLVKSDEEKQTPNKNTNFVAIASLYSNIFNKKKLVCRFTYQFTKQGNRYFLEETSYNKEINHLNNFTYISYKHFIQTLKDFLEKQYVFDDFDILDLKYFVVKNVYTHAYDKVSFFSLKHVSFLKDTVDSILKKFSKVNVKIFNIKFYHATFSINLYLQQESLGAQSFLNLLHVTHQLHDLDTTSETFYSYKTIIFDIKFLFKNEIKQFAIIIPIQDQRISKCMYDDFSAEILTGIMAQNLEDVETKFPEHLNYLHLVFEHVLTKEHVFNAAKFASLGIQRLVYKKHFIDFVMCKVLIKDQRMKNLVCKTFRNIDMERICTCANFRNFKNNDTFKKIIKTLVTDKICIKLKSYIKKRIEILYDKYRQNIFHLNPNKLNYIYMHDKNKIKDPELNKVLGKFIMCDSFFLS